MAKKNYRADGTYLIEGNQGDNPKLMGRVLSDGRVSLYLEYYLGKREKRSKAGTTYMKSERETEGLSLYLWQAPRSTEEREQNKETLGIAKKLRFERGQELLENEEGYRLRKHRNINFLDWMQGYYDSYTKQDKRHIKRARLVFMDFLVDPHCELDPDTQLSAEENERRRCQKEEMLARLDIKPKQITRKMIEEFTEYLQRRFRGDGPHSLYSRFKKVFKAATDAEVFKKNPCEGVIVKKDNGTLKKDVLSIEEVQRLASTHYEGENPHIRRAFLFSCSCGIRWCDITGLTFANVDYSNRILRFEQAKTKGHSSASGVAIPLNDGLLKLIGRPGEGQTRDSLIFPLPSDTMCRKALRRWTKRAGIDKHITWHCARHSFATNILGKGANVKVVAELLGHSDLAMVQKYVRAIDRQKKDAINSLPELDI